MSLQNKNSDAMNHMFILIVMKNIKL